MSLPACNRRESIRQMILPFVIGFMLTIGHNSFSAAIEEKPNIVLIMADDLGYECIGCNGGLSYQTPNLDRIAQKGLRFENCHSQPLCTPTRNQIMTGKYNFRNYENFEYLAPDQETFGQLLKDAGYQTCIAGKWQLNGRGWKRKGRAEAGRPQSMGFDQSCLWQVTGLGNRYRSPELEINGEYKTFPNQYGPDICVDFISKFIEENREKPFFVYYPMILPHGPFVSTPDSSDWASGQKSKTRQEYFGDMVAYTDKLVGRIEESLKQNGVLDNTLLIFTGDNGTTRGLVTQTRNGEVPGAKGMTIDAGTHVPLIVSGPKLGAKGQVCKDLIDFTDVLPTLVAASGSKLPTDFLCDGSSFLPQIQGQPGTPRKYVYCFYDPVHSNNVNQFRNRFARNTRFKVYRDGKVFDVNKDPKEVSPLDRQQLGADELKQIEFLESVINRYDGQGAAEAAKQLASKVRPAQRGKKKSNNKKTGRKKTRK